MKEKAKKDQGIIMGLCLCHNLLLKAFGLLFTCIIKSCLLDLHLVASEFHPNVGEKFHQQHSQSCRSLTRFITCFEIVHTNLLGDVSLGDPSKQWQGHPTNSPVDFGSTTRAWWAEQNTPGPADKHPTLNLKFTAFEMNFSLSLFLVSPSEMETLGVLISSAKVTTMTSQGAKSHTLADTGLGVTYCIGLLDGEASKVHGHCDNGEFSGVVHTGEETFYVEPARNYFTTITDDKESYVVYKRSDVELDAAHTKRTVKYAPGSYASEDFMPRSGAGFETTRSRQQLNNTGNYPDFMTITSPLVNEETLVCNVHVVADHTYFTNVGERSISKVIAEIIYHITEADDIFRHTDFNADGQEDNIGFVITAYTIYEDDTTPGYNFADENNDADSFLDKFSMGNFNSVCLGIMFTYRDFEDGIIGLAWTASSSFHTPGGICQPRMFYSNPPVYPAGYYSFNTFVVSQLNFGAGVPREVLSLTVTHEFGHAFGSHHDDPKLDSCSPGGSVGNYIMHPYSSNADKTNNWKFSPCSKQWMSPVIRNKGHCLEITAGPTCGNRVVEFGEQCDCGYPALCQVTDHCCSPPSVSGANNTGCRFAKEEGKVCSPVQSSCCSNTCQPFALSANKVCRRATDCTMASVCDGENYTCPQPKHLPDTTPCNNGEGVCQNGKCSTSICHTYGLVDCQCTQPKRDLCKVCCGCPVNTQETCVSADSIDILGSEGEILYLAPGHACSNDKGYCNEKRLCTSMGQEVLFAPQLVIENIKDWFADHWLLLVLLASVILLLLIALYRSNVCTIRPPHPGVNEYVPDSLDAPESPSD